MGQFFHGKSDAGLGGKGFFNRTLQTGPPFAFVPRTVPGATLPYAALGVIPGKALISDSAGNTFLSVDGGHTWTQKAFGTATPGVGVLIHDNGVWIGDAGAGQISRSTDDGATWTLISTTTALGQPIVSLGTSGSGNVVALSGDSFPSANYSVSANDGLTWGASGSIDTTFYGNVTVWDGSQYITTLQNNASGTSLMTSPDGSTWTQTNFDDQSDQFGQAQCSLAFNSGSGFYVVLGTGGYRASSTAIGLTTATNQTSPPIGAVPFWNMVFSTGIYFYLFDGTRTGVWRTQTPEAPSSWQQGSLSFTHDPTDPIGGYDSTNASLIIISTGGFGRSELFTLKTI